MDIVFAADRHFTTPLEVAVFSLVSNAFRKTRLRIWIATDRNEIEIKEVAERIAERSGVDVRWLPLDTSSIAGAPVYVQWSKATYFRILIPEQLPSCVDRFVYLDSDVIVEKDLEPLYHSDLGDKALGAVRNFRQRNDRGPVDFSRVPYFNAGVLVVSRREWIACQFSERALDCMASHPEGLRNVDQDALNFALKGDWTSLDSRWNQQSSVWEISYRSLGISQDAMKSLRNNPFIIHFSGHRKPWHFGDDHPLGRRFFHYGRLAKISLPNPKPENAVELLRRATKFVTPRRCRPVVRGALVNAKGFGRRLGLG